MDLRRNSLPASVTFKSQIHPEVWKNVDCGPSIVIWIIQMVQGKLRHIWLIPLTPQTDYDSLVKCSLWFLEHFQATAILKRPQGLKTSFQMTRNKLDRWAKASLWNLKPQTGSSRAKHFRWFHPNLSQTFDLYYKPDQEAFVPLTKCIFPPMKLRGCREKPGWGLWGLYHELYMRFMSSFKINVPEMIHSTWSVVSFSQEISVTAHSHDAQQLSQAQIPLGVWCSALPDVGTCL